MKDNLYILLLQTLGFNFNLKSTWFDRVAGIVSLHFTVRASVLSWMPSHVGILGNGIDARRQREHFRVTFLFRFHTQSDW